MNFPQIVAPVYAQVCNPLLKDCSSSTNPKGYFNNVIQGIFSIFFVVGIVYFIWHIIFAGYHLIGSQGDPKAFETSKNELTYAFVGLIIMFSIFAILKFVGQILGINGLGGLVLPWPSL